MTDTPLHISVEDTIAEQDDRFHRFKLISWWDQDRLKNAKVLVIGAGALGNELLKNLSLLGVGNVIVADMDRIENSNLSRSVLYRAKDNGQLKATAAARAALRARWRRFGVVVIVSSPWGAIPGGGDDGSGRPRH